MTVEEAYKRVERIRRMAGDDEAAHGAEDEFREEVLKVIASGQVTEHTAQELAQIALSTSEIAFARWCA